MGIDNNYKFNYVFKKIIIFLFGQLNIVHIVLNIFFLIVCLVLFIGTESETKAFMAVCIETAKRYNLDDYRTPVFIFERLCSIIYPVSCLYLD